MIKEFKPMVALMLLAMGGCAGPDEGYVKGFQEAAALKVDCSEEAQNKGLERFKAFYREITPDTVRAGTEALYAPHLYFNDTLKTLRSEQAVQDYFLKTTTHVESMRVVVDDVARSGADCYVRWTMDVRFKGSKKPVRTIGVTLLRFDHEGRIVLHQDFWDPAAGFYEHLPVVGGLLRWIKSKI